MVLWRPTRPFRTNTQKRCPFHYRGLECKSRKSRNTWSNRQIWAWSTEWSRAKANRVLPRERTGHSKHPLPTTQEKPLHMDITKHIRWPIFKSWSNQHCISWRNFKPPYSIPSFWGGANCRSEKLNTLSRNIQLCEKWLEKLVFPFYVVRMFKPPIGCARKYCHNSFHSLLYNNWSLILLEFSSVLSIRWKDWCWSWNSNTLATWWKELTHWKGPWCWERLKAGGKGDNRGWDGWMASLTQWTWVWLASRRWWWTGKPGVLWFMGLQRVRHDWVTVLNWTEAWGGNYNIEKFKMKY